MDDRTLEAAENTTAVMTAASIAESKDRVKTYTVIVIGRTEPLTIQAVNAEQRGAKMSAAGIDLVEDDWAAGYLDGDRRFQICGNNAEARTQLQKLLRRR